MTGNQTMTRVNTMCRGLFAIAAALLIASPASARNVERPPDGMAMYILVLRSPELTAGKEDGSPKKKFVEPDIAAAGGRVVQTHLHRRLIMIPEAAAEALRQHESVAYLQRMWTGQPPDQPKQEASSKVVQAATIVRTQDEDPSWSIGPYGYDGSGNITTIGNMNGAVSNTYAYDPLGRLKQSVVNGTTETYTYDPYGNMTRRETGSQTPLVIAVDPTTNRITSTSAGGAREYDLVGNLKEDADGNPYHYDALGMLTGMKTAAAGLTKTMRMIYTADDERIAVTTKIDGTSSPETRYRIRGFGGEVLREWKDGTLGMEWERDYVYAGGRLVAGERQVDTTQNGKRHFHLDHLGSVRLVTRGADGVRISGHDYFPFGQEATSTIEEHQNFGYMPLEPMKYTGHERDYHGDPGVADTEYLDYMHARYYDPALGRFLSVDPTWASVDIGKPQAWNRYSYVTNNPSRYTDPDGKIGIDPIELARAAYATGAEFVADVVLDPGPEFGDGELPKDPAERAKYIEQHLDQPGGPKQGSSGGPGAGKQFSRKTKDEARAQSNDRCVFCGTETTRTPGPNQSNIDHADPKSRSGNNTLKNAQNTCKACNLKKAAKKTLEYVEWLIKKAL